MVDSGGVAVGDKSAMTQQQQPFGGVVGDKGLLR